jgi:cathepsin L
MRFFTTLVAAGATIAAARPALENESFDSWVAEFPQFAKQSDASVFAANLAEIRKHNADPTQTWKKGVNQFTGMTKKQFKAFIGQGYSRAGPAMAAARAGGLVHDGTHDVDVSALPNSLDWRTVSPSVVTAVKNQGGCGGCWSFSAAETMESAVAIKTGKLFVFSEQEILDCTPNPNDCGGTGGCSGATQELAFGYVVGEGITTEADYPYTGSSTFPNCQTAKIKPVAGITGYVTVPFNNYTALMNAVVNIGPIAISAAAEPWQSYDSGVFTGPCNEDVDHAIVLEGYGTDAAAGQDYYLVRNSWGASWGEKGYIRVARYGSTPNGEPCGQDTTPGDGDGCSGGPSAIKVCGLCGILSDSSYPTGGHLV